MTEVSACVICNGSIRKLKPALVAPFIACRNCKRVPFTLDLVQCQCCGFVFDTPRPDDELACEYVGYHSDEHLQMRSFGPRYTAKFNADLASSDHYQLRRAKLTPIFQQPLRGRTFRRFLDHGDLMLGLVGDAQLFLYGISGAAPTPGVTAGPDVASCRPDLTLNSNVVEHIGFSRARVTQIFHAAPLGLLVFLETPCENALSWRRILRRIAQIPLMIAAQPRLTAQLLQRATLRMMHEHSEKSRTTLMRNCRGRVLAPGFADLHDHSEFLVDMIRTWESGAPIVVGIKNTSDESWLMYRLRAAYYRLVARLTNVGILAHFTEFGRYDRVVIDKIRSDFRDPYPYFQGMITELGLPVTHVHYNQNRRACGISQNLYPLYDFAMTGITNLSKVPLPFVIFIGFACAFISFLAGMFYLIYKLVFLANFKVGIAPVVLGLFFLGSVQLIALGIGRECVGSLRTLVLNRLLVTEKERISF
jgi:hypothetical protein